MSSFFKQTILDTTVDDLNILFLSTDKFFRQKMYFKSKLLDRSSNLGIHRQFYLTVIGYKFFLAVYSDFYNKNYTLAH